ncbi:hypothetical protein BBAD15_g2526 [Beauveria bassiana D1-5]|uniref:Uncharacterized protein n=1 Tax=Beauveria bassiana D1-5 TaxID=1245745 RepID=A0A0A2WF32_BEABA|nr:hypothetical protein BBAD15_g2526 [Beauveria bassiana D1-5]
MFLISSAPTTSHHIGHPLLPASCPASHRLQHHTVSSITPSPASHRLQHHTSRSSRSCVCLCANLYASVTLRVQGVDDLSYVLLLAVDSPAMLRVLQVTYLSSIANTMAGRLCHGVSGCPAGPRVASPKDLWSISTFNGLQSRRSPPRM